MQLYYYYHISLIVLSLFFVVTSSCILYINAFSVNHFGTSISSSSICSVIGGGSNSVIVISSVKTTNTQVLSPIRVHYQDYTLLTGTVLSLSSVSTSNSVLMSSKTRTILTKLHSTKYNTRSDSKYHTVRTSFLCGLQQNQQFSSIVASSSCTTRFDTTSTSTTTSCRGKLMMLTDSSSKMSETASAAAATTTYNTNNYEKIKHSLLNCPKITLRNGIEHPCIGFGTYKVGYIPPSASSIVANTSTSTSSTTATTDTATNTQQQQQQRTAADCVYDAIDVGYRFIECAEFYGNEKDVGIGIKRSNINRSELFLVSKVWTTTIEKGPKAIRQQLVQTLSDLQTSYIDLYLIHWPVPIHHISAYQTLIELRNEGLIRGIGISNYAYEDYVELKNTLQLSTTDLPLVNQIEINPFLFRSNTIQLFQQDNVIMQSYRSLRDGKVMNHPILLEIRKKYTNKTVAQILGRWCVQHSFIYIPKSIHKYRMIENSNIFINSDDDDTDFVLSDNDMTILDTTLTTNDALQTYELLYRKCVNRDTSKDGTVDNVKMNITIN